MQAPTPGGSVGDTSSLARPGYKGKRRTTDYERQIAHALMRKGKSKSQAIAMARGLLNKAAATGRWGRKGKASGPVRAGAAASIAQRASFSNTGDAIDLANFRYRHGWIKLGEGSTDGMGKAAQHGPAGYESRNLLGPVKAAVQAEMTRRHKAAMPPGKPVPPVKKSRGAVAVRRGKTKPPAPGARAAAKAARREAARRQIKLKPRYGGGGGQSVATYDPSFSNGRGTVVVDLAWSPDLHPRDWRGRFALKNALRGEVDKKGRVVPTPAEIAQHEAHVRRVDADIIRLDPQLATHNDGVNGRTFKDADGNEVTEWSKERAALHRDLVNTVFRRQAKTAKQERKALFLGGLPGAGKSTSIDKIPGMDQKNYIVINPDSFKEEMAQRGLTVKVDGMTPLEASAFHHEESSTMALMLAAKARKHGYNIIWDITMSSPGGVSKRIKPLRDEGYNSITSMFVDIPFEESQRRVEQRHRSGYLAFVRDRTGQHTGQRLVPSSHVKHGISKKGSSSANRDAFEAVKGQFDGYKVIDNMASPPQVIDERGPFVV